MDRRKQEDELKRVMQQEEHFQRVKELWKSKRKDQSHAAAADEGGHSEKKKKERKRRKKDKHKEYDGIEEPEADMVEEPEQMMDDDDAELMDRKDEGGETGQDLLTAAGLEDEDATDEPASTTISRWRRAWSESDEEEKGEMPAQSSRGVGGEENYTQFQDSDADNGEHRLRRERSEDNDDKDI